MGGGGNWEFQYYVNNRTNSFINNSILYLKPTLTSDRYSKEAVDGTFPTTLDVWGSSPADSCTSNAFFGCARTSGNGFVLNPIQSARLRTAGTFSFKYGRLEVVAKLPLGDWLWPAIWLLPEDQVYGYWPASGDIDVMESRGNNASYPDGGVNCFGSTLHFGPFYPEDPFHLTNKQFCLHNGKTLHDDFHIYGLVWNEREMYSYIDDDSQRVMQVHFNESFWVRGGWDKNPHLHNPWQGQAIHAPFDQKFYLVLNVAVGGAHGYFPNGIGDKPWTDGTNTEMRDFNNALPRVLQTWDLQGVESAMAVKSVRVWQ